MSNSRGKTHFSPPIYFYEYIRLGIVDLGKNETTDEKAKLVFDQKNTNDETIALSVGNSRAPFYPWVHMIHTITSSDESVTITREQRSGSVDLKVKTQSSVINAGCYSGEITSDDLDEEGRCWLNVEVNPDKDYWTVHVYKVDGQEVFPQVRIQTPNNGDSHLWLSFNSKEVFGDMCESYNKLYVKVLIVNTDVHDITVKSSPYDEPIIIDNGQTDING